jgi:hypothetical protein
MQSGIGYPFPSGQSTSTFLRAVTGRKTGARGYNYMPVESKMRNAEPPLPRGVGDDAMIAEWPANGSPGSGSRSG